MSRNGIVRNWNRAYVQFGSAWRRMYILTEITWNLLEKTSRQPFRQNAFRDICIFVFTKDFRLWVLMYPINFNYFSFNPVLCACSAVLNLTLPDTVISWKDFFVHPSPGRRLLSGKIKSPDLSFLAWRSSHQWIEIIRVLLTTHFL